MYQQNINWNVDPFSIGQKSLELRVVDGVCNLQQVCVKQKPWICPQCDLRFKWDVQLLRHQRKSNHKNPGRRQRLQKRYQKKINKKIKCTQCSSYFDTPSERIDHQRWCQSNPKTLKLRQSYLCKLPEDTQEKIGKKYIYECSQHEVPFYFTTLDMLKDHIKSHKKLDSQKVRKVMQIFKQIKKKRRGLTKREYLQISKRLQLNVAVSTLRKWFSKIEK